MATTEQERNASPATNGMHRTYGYEGNMDLLTILAEDIDEA